MSKIQISCCRSELRSFSIFLSSSFMALRYYCMLFELKLGLKCCLYLFIFSIELWGVMLKSLEMFCPLFWLAICILAFLSSRLAYVLLVTLAFFFLNLFRYTRTPPFTEFPRVFWNTGLASGEVRGAIAAGAMSLSSLSVIWLDLAFSSICLTEGNWIFSVTISLSVFERCVLLKGWSEVCLFYSISCPWCEWYVMAGKSYSYSTLKPIFLPTREYFGIPNVVNSFFCWGEKTLPLLGCKLSALEIMGLNILNDSLLRLIIDLD